jgi:glycosyltransferase involved in cell wall biosynthesis
MNRTTDKRAAIFVYYGWLSVSPSITGTIRMLSAHGYAVDVVYLFGEKHGLFSTDAPTVRAVAVSPYRGRYSRLLRFLIACWKAVKGRPYSVFIGIDPEGVIVAGIIGWLKRVPYAYYSLEILAEEDIAKEKGIRRLLLVAKKRLEAYFSRKAQVTVVQDERRRAVLLEGNGIDKGKVVLIPNSYGPRDLKPEDCTSYDLGLPRDKKAIIYAGSIIPQMGIKDMLVHMDSWPEEACLVLHTPYKTDYLNEIQKAIIERGLQSRVVVSVKNLAVEQLYSLVNRAHIGISLCSPIDKNHELSPSGKIAVYLSCGLPIIVNDIPPSVALISKHRCGLCVETPDKIGDAVQEILSRYSQYSLNAKRCYDEEMDVSKGFSELMRRFESLS